MKKTMIYITKEQHEALRTLAFETKLTMSDHIRQAIDAYLAKKENAK
jgi:predicted DNA-binding protein